MKMKRILPLIYVLLVLTACSHSREEEGGGGSAIRNTVDVIMKIYITSPTSSTRAYVTEESKVNSVALLVFERNNSLPNDAESATFLYSRTAWQQSGTTYRTTLPTGSNLDIYYAINADASLIASVNEGETFAEAYPKLVLTNPEALVKDNLPMWGILQGVTLSESDEVINLGTISLLRSVASTDIVIKDTSFNFEEGTIVYATNQGYLAHRFSDVSSATGQITGPLVPSGTTYTTSWTESATTNADSYQSIENVFYFFDNDATASTSQNYTKLIIKGSYDGGTATYYPLAFRNNNQEKIQAARNRKFTITVNNVHSDGYETIEEAMEADDVAVDYEVLEWDDYSNEIEVTTPDGTLYYVSFTDGRTAQVGDLRFSEAYLFFSSNAITWESGAPTNVTMWFTDDTTTTSTTGSVASDRFNVDLIQQSDGEYYFFITTLAAYAATSAGNYTQTVTVNIGDLLQFTITMTQLQNGWTQGSDNEVIVS